MKKIALSLFIVSMLNTLAFAGQNQASTVKPLNIPAVKKDSYVFVSMQTSKGEIILQLNETKAPKTVANFKKYIHSGFYKDTIFHRIISHFMIQGGGFTVDYEKKKTLPPIKNEASNGLLNVKGSIAMARTSLPNSATSQFFINVNSNPRLNYPGAGGGYAVFGRVVKGLEVIESIRWTATAPKPRVSQYTPLEAVTIKNVTILKDFDMASKSSKTKEAK